MNNKEIFASTQIKFFLITLLWIGIYVFYQIYGLSIGHDFLKKYQYHQERLLNFSNKLYIGGGQQRDYKSDENSIANKLYNEVRVLCWINTNPINHQKKARHVQRTWSKRCNKVLFMSSETDAELETIALPVEEGRNNLWGKTKEAFKYIYKHHLNEYDWFLKADDDTYVIVENLRYMLYPYDPKSPLYFGCRFKPFVKQGYMYSGAGYVLSKESVKMFIEGGLSNLNKCRKENDGEEDVRMGKCLENIGVKAADSRDSNKRGRFFPLNPIDHVVPLNGYAPWYWKAIYYKANKGFDCCSNYAISFHNVSPKQMYFLDYFIYQLRPFGIHLNKKQLENKMATNKNINNKTLI